LLRVAVLGGHGRRGFVWTGLELAAARGRRPKRRPPTGSSSCCDSPHADVRRQRRSLLVDLPQSDAACWLRRSSPASSCSRRR
jgi:hypothetical protein